MPNISKTDQAKAEARQLLAAHNAAVSAPRNHLDSVMPAPLIDIVCQYGWPMYRPISLDVIDAIWARRFTATLGNHSIRLTIYDGSACTHGRRVCNPPCIEFALYVRVEGSLCGGAELMYSMDSLDYLLTSGSVEDIVPSVTMIFHESAHETLHNGILGLSLKRAGMLTPEVHTTITRALLLDLAQQLRASAD